jgi:phosphoglycolate phosphatase-like HAD superfamily hydrolase
VLIDDNEGGIATLHGQTLSPENSSSRSAAKLKSIRGKVGAVALLLFDIDGTLLRGGDPTHARAFDAVCREVFGVPGDVRKTELSGRTDRHILRAVLALQGVSPTDAQIVETFRRMEDYVERELTHSLADRVLPGVPALLAILRERGHTLGLVTGNLPRIAKVKLARASLWDAFHPVGAFGDLSEVRADLVRAAMRHVPADQTVVIGDTLHDIECGRANATRTIAVATGHVSAADLSGADLVLDTLAQHDQFLQFVGALA